MKLNKTNQIGGKVFCSERVFTRGLRNAALCLLTFGLVSVPTLPASADYGNIRFNGAISNSGNCTIVVRNGGNLGVSTNIRQLSSKIAGGSAGSVDLVSNGFYRISVDTPAVFAVAPLGGDVGVTRQVLFSGVALNAAASFAERTAPIFASGFLRTRMTINFIANRPTAYPGGHYEALTIVRCEPS